MDIYIVGSGICGLTAAIGLRKAGHKVKVFERSSTATAFGAGVVLGHNVSLVMDGYGLDWKAARATSSKILTVVNGTTLDKITTTSMDQANYEPRPGVKQLFLHRVDLQEALVELATNKNGAGQPVEIVYNAVVKSYDATNGSFTLEDGTTHKADLIVAADGVHSRAPAQLLGHEFDPKHTGTSIVRFMLPTDSVQEDPATAALVNDPGESTFYVSADRSRYLLRYPVRDGTLQNFGLYTINKDSVEIDDQIHRFTCDQESLAKELYGFHPSLLALVPKTTEILPVWKLVERTPMPTWHQGRLLTIGDASHPMLPNQGQGAGMAVEDSAALAVVFQNMPAKPSLEQISARLAVFEKVRKPRASVVQLLSSAPYFENGMKVMLPKLLEQMPREQLPGLAGPQDTRPWLFNYDVVSVAKGALHELLAAA